MSGIKLFDLNRLAKFEDAFSGHHNYFVPGDLSAVTVDGDKLWVFLPNDLELCVKATPEEFEAEMNRALGATRDSMKAYEEELAQHLNEKLRALQHDVDEQKQEAAFRNNDFYADPLDKNKKGVN